MKLSSSPSSFAKIALLSLLWLCAINKKALSQVLTSSDSAAVELLKTQLELLKPDTLTPTKVNYTYLGTPRAPADSVISSIILEAPQGVAYNVPMMLVPGYTAVMTPQSGPIGSIYDQTSKILTVSYGDVYYHYSIESKGGKYDIKIAVGRFEDKGAEAAAGVEQRFVIGQDVSSDDPLFVNMQNLFDDAQQIEGGQKKNCVPYVTPVYQDSSHWDN
jgi:hypothetical protein